MTPFWLDHLLAAVLTLFFPIRAATFGYRRLALAPDERVPNARRALYFQAIAIMWGLSTLALLIWWRDGRSALALGLEPREAGRLAWGLAGAAITVVGLWIVRLRVRREPEALARALHRLSHIQRMLPHTVEDRRIFNLVALTAGICEELLYRGYMLWYLAHWLDVVPAVVVSSLIFGVGHAYQGWRGMLSTGVLGLVLAGIYLVSGSLWPAMVVHTALDAHAGSLAYSALTQPAAEPVGAQPAPESELG